MKKLNYLLIIGALMLTFISTSKAQTPADSVDAKLEFLSIGDDAWQKHWYLIDTTTKDTISRHNSKDAANFQFIMSDDIIQGPYIDTVLNIRLKVGRTYEMRTYSVDGYGWKKGLYIIYINNNNVASNNLMVPNNAKPDSVIANFLPEDFIKYNVDPSDTLPRPYDLESSEFFVAKPILANDIAILSMTPKKTNCSLSATQSIKVRLANLGTDTKINFPITLMVDGAEIATQNCTKSVEPLNLEDNASDSTVNVVEFTFTNKVDMSAKKSYNVEIFLKNADENPSNDTLRLTVENATATEIVQSNTGTEYFNFKVTPAGYDYYPNVISKMTFCGMPNDFTVKYLKIDSLSHTFLTNTVLTLVSPSFDTAFLAINPGMNIMGIMQLGGRGIYNTTFTDTAIDTMGSQRPYYIYKDQNLKICDQVGDFTFEGCFDKMTDPNGEWQLQIYDRQFTNGFLKGWELGFGKKITGINETPQMKAIQFVAYPNPANEVLNIRTNEFNLGASYEIVNLQGQVVASGKATSMNTTIDINSLSKGLYFINMKKGAIVETAKFSKQ